MTKRLEDMCDRERFGDPCHVCDAEDRARKLAAPTPLARLNDGTLAEAS